jgi:mono/diheme cytochrome c family protein
VSIVIAEHTGQEDYNEHCAGCHGIDGSGKNRLEADFYPPVPSLAGDA